MILLISGVIKQKLLHEKGIVKLLQNCKCYNVGQDDFGKSLFKPNFV